MSAYVGKDFFSIHKLSYALYHYQDIKTLIIKVFFAVFISFFFIARNKDGQKNQ